MKKNIFIHTILAAVIAVLFFSCTPNARPFEMLVGIAPASDLDVFNLPALNCAITQDTNTVQWYIGDDFSIATDSTNIIMMNGNQIYMQNIATGSNHLVNIDGGQLYYGCFISGSNIMTTGRVDQSCYPVLLRQKDVYSNITIEQSIDWRRFYGFQVKHIIMNTADNTFWFVRQHKPIQTDSIYPESETPMEYEMIRKYTFAFSNANQYGPVQIVSMRVPGGSCSGIALLNGNLYCLFRTPRKDGDRIQWQETQARTIFVIDAATLEYKGKLNKTIGSAQGLTTDGTKLYTLGDTNQNTGQRKIITIVP
ncbi:MAG: hypothetical protein HZC28_16545 [Spirochaetes bacterium]|nr:hypothetical protein [Spirochaetota bacterium]